MPRIERVRNPYILPENALCLTSTGWVSTTEEVQLSLQKGLTLIEALNILWAEHRGLLGEGDLVFACTADEPFPTGYMTFQPTLVETLQKEDAP